MIEPKLTKRIIEAALLAANQPMSVAQLAALFDEADALPHEQLARALEQLGEDCATRGIELVEVASGFRYQVRQDVQPWISRMWTDRQSRYSRALLETLALIAYRQPITRGEIEQIRGVAVSSNIVKTLEEREWVRVVGHRDVPGKPALLGTTRTFLDYFNLRSLDQLPALSDIRDIDEIEPQLALAPVDPVDADAIPADVALLAHAAQTAPSSDDPVAAADTEHPHTNEQDPMNQDLPNVVSDVDSTELTP